MCYPWPQRPVEKGQPFPMEYLRWHKELLKLFQNYSDYKFIWKGSLLEGQEFDFVNSTIINQEYNNIEYHVNKLSKWFNKVEKMIFDTPSTAFFESIFSGIPSLALYRENDQILRENAYKEFGVSLKAYNSIDEGIKIVERFLNDNSKEYIVDIKIPESKLIEIILS